MKLSTQLSSGREDRRDSDHAFNGIEMTKTFISTSDHYALMGAMEDRISKLENLVWSLYKELNGKIDSASASTQLQLEEIAGQITLSQPVKQSEDGDGDEGYEGSEEENYLPNEQKFIEAEGEDNFIQGSLDKVDEELSSQYYSNEEKEEFSRNTIDKSDPLVNLSRDKTPYDYQPVTINFIENQGKEDILQKQISYDHSSPNFYGNNGTISKESDTPENSDDENELEYYFSCHERMVHNYSKGNIL